MKNTSWSNSGSQNPVVSQLPVWFPLLLLIVTVIVLFYKLFFGDSIFWGLPALQFYPWREFALSELRSGRLPLWNPYNGAGEPLFANYQSALLYPPNLLSLVLIPGPQAMGILAALHLIWAGIGMYLWTKSLGLPPFASGIGALAYALNGAVVARFGTQPMVDVAAWLPWLIWAVERIIRRPSVLNGILLTSCTAMQLLAGHAQWTAYSLLLTILYMLYRVFVAPNTRLFTQVYETSESGIQEALFSQKRMSSAREQKSENDSPRAKPLLILGLTMVSLVLALAIAGAQLLPTAELQRESQRANGADEVFALNFSYEWPILLTQLTPNFFGNPGDGSYILNGAAFETASYIGILPLILAIFITMHCLRRWRRLHPRQNGDLSLALVPFFAGLTVIAFMFALGKNSALYLFLFHHIPGFNVFQAPARWLLLATFSLSTLAAVGASQWQNNRVLLRRARLGLAAGIGITVIGAIAYFALSTEMTPNTKTLTRGFLTLGLQLTAVAIAFVSQPDTYRNAKYPNAYRRWSIGLLIFVAADLIWANLLFNPTVSSDFYQPMPAQNSVNDKWAARIFKTDQAINNAEFDKFLLFKNYAAAVENKAEFRFAGLPNLNLLDRVSSFNTFEPLRPLGIDHFTQLLNDPDLTSAVLSHLSQAAAIGPNSPRAWLTTDIVISTDPFAAMQSPSWAPYNTAIIEPSVSSLPASINDTTRTGTVDITSQTPLELIWTVHVTSPSVLTVADTWYPGWEAMIDGQPTIIYRVNGTFRGIYLQPGNHTVSMRYQPHSLYAGVAISGAALILVLIMTAWEVRRSRQMLAACRSGRLEKANKG